jgi:general secretion pathway protein D
MQKLFKTKKENKKMMKCVNKFFLIFPLILSFLFAEGAKEGHSFDERIAKDNESLKQLRGKLREKSLKANDIFAKNGGEGDLLSLKEEVKKIKDEIYTLEAKIRQDYVEDPSSNSDESYAFWDQGETTLSQLIMEYGSSDYLYVIPPELAAMKINLFSAVPIPRSSWSDMIELILSNNGIGVKKVNSFVRQLYVIKQDLSCVDVVASELKDIAHLPDHTMIFYVFSTNLEQVKLAQSFFERYADPKQVNVQVVGNKVVIVSNKKNVERLIQLHDAVWGTDTDKVVKVIKLTKLNAVEVEKVIRSLFGEQSAKTRTPFFQYKLDDVVILPLPDNTSMVLVGDRQMVQRAEKMVNDLECQLDEPGEMTIFWYTCKHSDPQDVADVLSRVYSSINSSSIEGKPTNRESSGVKTEINQDISCKSSDCERLNIYNPVNPVTPGVIEPGKIDYEKKVKATNNFVVDGKTGSILMTVRKEELEKIKTILKKLDVPKKMTQIDVLLVERRLQDRKQSGINILKIGTNDVKDKQNSVSFDTSHHALKKGILDFIFRKPKGDFPSFDFTLSFLMAQDDLKINANPSVLAVNQTPATISIVEEISISNGAVQVSCPTGWNVEKSFTRAQFGITIVMTPTIHLPDSENPEEKGFVTLQTNVTFDTSQAIDNDRPPVTRRHIENEVRIADGETIILGGLRRKSQEDSREKIPFLGDIPGIGKLFGTTKLCDHSTEMFIFITPKIIKDPIEDLRIERQKFLSRRPGDIPEFLQKIECAKNCERKRLFENSMRVLFDKQ